MAPGTSPLGKPWWRRHRARSTSSGRGEGQGKSLLETNTTSILEGKGRGIILGDQNGRHLLAAQSPVERRGGHRTPHQAGKLPPHGFRRAQRRIFRKRLGRGRKGGLLRLRTMETGQPSQNTGGQTSGIGRRLSQKRDKKKLLEKSQITEAGMDQMQ